mmetsp:Transcript_111523/g.315764  ORF Transcript_111523/g.315764 Transcript_111523/m.315764 type:complete len:82 (+) Transcript_111523:1-246(+)
MGCAVCGSRFRLTRKQCALKKMGFSPKCISCQGQAFKYYEKACVKECGSTFRHGVVTATAKCRKCNDVMFAMLNDCNAVSA